MGEVMKSKNIIYIATVIISILVLVSIISIAFFTWPKADDFSQLNEIRRMGIIQHIVYRYNNWDGRAISVGLIQALLLTYLPIEITNSILASCLIITSFISFLIFHHRLNFRWDVPACDYVIGTAIFSSVLWYGFKPHLADTVYWATGGIYIIALLFVAIWIYLWLTKFSFERKINFYHIVFFYIFSVYVGALTQNLSCAILAYMGTELIKSVLTKDTAQIKRRIFVLALLLIGFIPVILAPGNFIRSAYGPKSFILSLTAISMNYLKIAVRFTDLSSTLFVMLLISVPLMTMFFTYSSHRVLKNKLIIKLKRKYSISFNGMAIRDVTVKVLTLFQFFIAAFASILPFTLIPDFKSPRTSIYFMGFLFFWTYFEIVPFILRRITRTQVYMIRHLPYRSHTMINVFLLCILSIMVTHIVRLREIKIMVLRREKFIETYSNKNIDVVTYSIDKTKLPFSYTFSDITSNKDHWINQAVAELYKVKSIRTADRFEP